MEKELGGRIYEDVFESRIYPRAVFTYTVHIPDRSDGGDEYALLVTHDGLNKAEAAALELLADGGEAPYCVTLGVRAARMASPHPDGCERPLRMNNYDFFSDKYPRFIIEELIPFVAEKYSLRISPSPDMHMVSGGSSGGISAWNMAWHRPDYFRRVYMSSPSFLSMGMGDEMVNLIRKTETKPIRVFCDYSENEPDDYFGSSFCVAMAAVRALTFAGYDMMSDYYPGEGHCSRCYDTDSAIRRMRFLWAGWRDTPVTVKGLSPRAEKLISADSVWEKCDRVLEKRTEAVSKGKYTRAGRYTAQEGRIVFTPDGAESVTVADGFDEISAICFSSDKWRLYAADKRRGCIYAFTVREDGTLDEPYVHASLHRKTDFHFPGGLDMCVDHTDRLYVLTEQGIQTVRSFGLIDVILTSPDKADTVSLGEDGCLYVSAGGDTFRRLLKDRFPPDEKEASAPQSRGYYDD